MNVLAYGPLAFLAGFGAYLLAAGWLEARRRPGRGDDPGPRHLCWPVDGCAVPTCWSRRRLEWVRAADPFHATADAFDRALEARRQARVRRLDAAADVTQAFLEGRLK